MQASKQEEESHLVGQKETESRGRDKAKNCAARSSYTSRRVGSGRTRREEENEKEKEEEEDSNRDFSVIHFGKRQGSRKQEKEREPTRARTESETCGLGRYFREEECQPQQHQPRYRACVCVHVRYTVCMSTQRNGKKIDIM